MDYSTLNLDRLAKLKQYTLPPSYRLPQGSGNGCYGDPPGFPTYFTRNVYTASGNHRHGSPQYVITYQGVHYIVLGIEDNYDHDKAHARYLRLWRPLPLDHERTRLWIERSYRHFNTCYVDVERPEYGRPGTLIFPVPPYKLKSFRDDVRWNDEYRAAAQYEVDAYNRLETSRAAAIATPENHQAVRGIREFYPEYQPELDLIRNPPQDLGGQWWETEAAQPSEEECARTQRWHNSHPFNSSWCQWCGRSYAAAAEEVTA